MSEFHFLRPAWFLALVPALVLLGLLWRRRGPAANWQGIVSPALLPHLLLETEMTLRRLPLLALGLGWLLAVTALAGPTWERQPQPVYSAPADRVIVLDMSPSMGATDLRPDRLTRARLSIRNFLSQVQEGRTALVVFGAEQHVVTPLTDDVATIEALLPALTPDILPAPGDFGGGALRTAGELLQRVGSQRGEVLLFSDGVDDPADSLEAIQELRSRGTGISVVGVGTVNGAPLPGTAGGFETAPGGGVRLARLDESSLAALASAGGGRYLRLGEGAVTALLDQAVDRDPAHAVAGQQGLQRWVEKGPWLMLPLLLIAAVGFRRGWLAVLVVLLVPPHVQAFDWTDLWQRPDQQASRLLEQGEAAAAAERFVDSQWRAMARYQAGDYAAAAEEFDGENADSRYNRGNALARAGRLQEALAAYDQALQKQPGHKDARFNRELVEELMRQQEQSSQYDSTVSPQGESGDATGADQHRGSGANNDQQQQPAKSPADQAETGAGGKRTPAEQAQADAANEDRDESAGEAQAEQVAGEEAVTQDRDGDGKPEQPDSAEQARADVAPSADDATRAQEDAQAEAGTVAEQSGQLTGEQPHAPMNEQALALEQWLRQVPDDPAGLLRRKFMLEHLMRQKGQQTP